MCRDPNHISFLLIVYTAAALKKDILPAVIATYYLESQRICITYLNALSSMCSFSNSVDVRSEYPEKHAGLHTAKWGRMQ